LSLCAVPYNKESLKKVLHCLSFSWGSPHLSNILSKIHQVKRNSVFFVLTKPNPEHRSSRRRKKREQNKHELFLCEGSNRVVSEGRATNFGLFYHQADSLL
jgi:hypothetical protein